MLDPAGETRTFELTEAERRIIANSLEVNALCFDYFQDKRLEDADTAKRAMLSIRFKVLDDLALVTT